MKVRYELPLDQIELTALSKESVGCLKGTVLSTLLVSLSVHCSTGLCPSLEGLDSLSKGHMS